MTVSPGETTTAGPETGPAAERDAAGHTGARAGLSGLARGSVLSLGGSAVSASAGILVVLAITRTLPKDAAGTFFALTSVFLIAETIARLGAGTGLVYAISRARALGRPDRARAFLTVALRPVVLLGVALAVLLFVEADRVARLAGAGPGSDAADAVRVLAVLLPLTAVSHVLLAATRGHGNILPTVVVDRVARPLLQLAAVVLAVATGSLVAVAGAWAAPWVASALLAVWWLSRLQRPDGTGDSALDDRLRPWREFWSFTAPRALTTVVQMALQRLDIVLLTLLAGPVEAAIYTAATRFLVVGQTAGQGLASVLEPRLGRLLALDDRRAARTVYRTATAWSILLCWPLYLTAGVYADDFLDWFGSGYDTGVVVVLVLAGTMLVATGVGMVDVVLIMGGRTSWNLGNSITALLVNVAVNLVLIPPLGVLGAALAWAAAILVNNLLPLAQVWRCMGLHPFGAGTARAAGLALACFGVLPLVSRTVVGAGSAATLATTAIGAGLFLLCCWKWRRVLELSALRRSARRATAPARPDAPSQVR